MLVFVGFMSQLDVHHILHHILYRIGLNLNTGARIFLFRSCVLRGVRYLFLAV